MARVTVNKAVLLMYVTCPTEAKLTCLRQALPG
jgi:hypothetical protein